MTLKSSRLIWIDTETTGLNPHEEMLLEVGFKITDLNLETRYEYKTTIWSPEYRQHCIESKIDPFVWNMHKKSGLWVDAPLTGVSPAAARQNVLSWLKHHHVSTSEPICGSSVQFDRSWMEEWMPEAMGLFSYRNIDTSSIKEVCRRYNPILYSKLDEDVQLLKRHRVMPDLDDTIEEFRFYRDNFLFWKD